ncbi:hypothetical protein GCM10010495_61000 [Kitasatospora herbaricolor]|nr:hypothetical protein GCM10010495_61000 [Kitasatospora herbaricolor]
MIPDPNVRNLRAGRLGAAPLPPQAHWWDAAARTDTVAKPRQVRQPVNNRKVHTAFAWLDTPAAGGP